MACGYCKSVVCDPCPMCGVNLTMTPRAIRKPKAQASPQKPANRPMAQSRGVPQRFPANPNVPNAYGVTRNQAEAASGPYAKFAVGPQQQIEANDRKIALLTEELARKAQAVASRVKMVPPHIPAPKAPKAPLKPAQAVPMGFQGADVVRPVDRNLLADFTRAILRKPKQIESTCRVVENQTMPPVARGDWAGLARAVDLGMLSEGAAIELAQSWKAGAA